jgi:isopropylmalate/homocitrate/citramalate synthase
VTPDLEHDIRQLQLIRQAKDGGATWAVIGATLGGITGKEAKRQARRLGARVQRELMAAKRAG